MSKISNAFLMIKLLSNGRVYSVKELSMELGVTERMVRYYKEQLEMAGYIIESFKGPGGGYYINKNDIMNIDYFNKYDLEVLDRAEENIKNTNKILSEYKNVDVTVNKNDEKINIIDKCIKDKKSLLIDYLGTSGKIVKREIIPVNMFEFEDNTYVLAFCKLRGSIRHFTLSKILNIKEI